MTIVMDSNPIFFLDQSNINVKYMLIERSQKTYNITKFLCQHYINIDSTFAIFSPNQNKSIPEPFNIPEPSNIIGLAVIVISALLIGRKI